MASSFRKNARSVAPADSAMLGIAAPVIAGALIIVVIIAIAALILLNPFASPPDSYWQNEARPFTITNAVFVPGTGMMQLQNYLTGSLTLTKLEISDCTPYIVSTQFASGETKSVRVSCKDNGAAPGSAYSHSVVISYVDPSGVQSKQYGTKNLTGRLPK